MTMNTGTDGRECRYDLDSAAEGVFTGPAVWALPDQALSPEGFLKSKNIYSLHNEQTLVRL